HRLLPRLGRVRCPLVHLIRYTIKSCHARPPVLTSFTSRVPYAALPRALHDVALAVGPVPTGPPSVLLIYLVLSLDVPVNVIRRGAGNRLRNTSSLPRRLLWVLGGPLLPHLLRLFGRQVRVVDLSTR